jgi:hypothetical protein
MGRHTPEQRVARLRELGVLFDEEHIPRIGQYAWRVTARGYVEASSYFADEPRTIKLHRLVMSALQSAEQVDHINRNPLDNRVDNLRFVDPSTNIRNTDRVDNAKHIRYHKGYYELRLTINGINYNKTFNTLEDAQYERQHILDQCTDAISNI